MWSRRNKIRVRAPRASRRRSGEGFMDAIEEAIGAFFGAIWDALTSRDRH